MSWIQTFTGRKVDPMAMRAEDVCVEDIAHALAMKCRFTGHVPAFYSVAQHSVLVAQHCENKLWGLLHDAAEAYLFDASRPVKHGLRAAGCTLVDEIEASIMAAVCEQFGLPLEQPEDVKKADVLLLATEAKCFFGQMKLYKEWHHRPENGFETIVPAVIVPWTWEQSEKAFLDALRDPGICRTSNRNPC